MNLLRQRQDILVRHVLGVEAAKIDLAEMQRFREHVGQAVARLDVGRGLQLLVLRLAHLGDHVFGDRAADLFDLVGAQALMLVEMEQRVDEGVQHMGARIGLERNVAALPVAAQLGDHAVEVERVVGVLDMGAKHAVPPLDHAGRSGEAVLAHDRRRDAAMRGPARMHQLRPAAVGPGFVDARRHAARDADRVARALEVEIEQLAGDVGRAERADDAGRMEAAARART
ncbi:MAG: hypothetical protein WDO24_02170 [Pseudomonadota bacterium]